MITGLLSDTHAIDEKVIRAIMQEFQNRKVEVVVHCGDIEPQHLDPELFGGLPVFCALNKEQLEKPAFKTPPPGWTFTIPGERVIDIRHIRTYLGHKRSFDFLGGSEQSLLVFLDTLRKDYDGLRWVYSGHTHHQIFAQTRLVNFVNPGAVDLSFNGYEFAIVDTDTNETVFSRLGKTKPTIPTFSVGVISDSLRISKIDTGFWAKFAKEMADRNAGKIIHCGNIALEDIGRPELENFTVYCNLRPDQIRKVKSTPPNWRLIPEENPVIEINGYQFYVELDLGISLLERSEVEMHKLGLELRRRFHELDFVLCGFTHNALLVEQEQTCIVNPGDIVMDRNFAVICLPRNEITFGHVPLDPVF
jgi:predicted phosphodiesterase